uniref:Reverse transcriptase domain-containing protein n=1 Tax=Tanacetum cinerariifolium TaxID=118510 RepID=A0A699KDG3_TANCI|nr:reverse transcriptase domain-containing protein [Tanacetum cinerariifolium]
MSLEGDEILRVQGERTQGVAKTLLNTKKRIVKLRRVRAMSMTIQSSVMDKILATSIDTSKLENAPAEIEYEYEIRYHLVKENVVTDALSRKERVKPRHVRAMSMVIQYEVRGMTLAAQSEVFKKENSEMDDLPLGLADAAESVRDAIGFESHVLWAEIGESGSTGLELVQETTDKVSLVPSYLTHQSPHFP